MNKSSRAFPRSSLPVSARCNASEFSAAPSTHLGAPSHRRTTRAAAGWRLVGAPLALAACALASSTGLIVACAGDEAKRVAQGGESGQSGEAGATVTSGESPAMPGAGGEDDPGTAGRGNGGDSAVPQGGAGGSNAGGSNAGGSNAGGSNAGGSNAGGSNGGEPATTNGGAGGEPNGPVSICGPGMWSAGEGFCQVCPSARQAFELSCADYPSGQVFANLNDVLRFALVNLPDGVEVHEVSPEPVTVTYIAPDQSFVSEVRFGSSSWSVDLSQAPTPPTALVIPPFGITDVCGDTFQSLEPVRLNRVGDTGTTYVKVCP